MALDSFIQAIYDNDSEYIRVHIGHIQNLNAIGSKGETPLIRAIEDDDFDIIQLLFAHGADINLQGYGGNSPLHIAVSRAEDSYQIDLQDNGYSEDVQPDLSIVKYLLAQHPNLELKNSQGKTIQEMYIGWEELQDLIRKEYLWQLENKFY